MEKGSKYLLIGGLMGFLLISGVGEIVSGNLEVLGNLTVWENTNTTTLTVGNSIYSNFSTYDLGYGLGTTFNQEINSDYVFGIGADGDAAPIMYIVGNNIGGTSNPLVNMIAWGNTGILGGTLYMRYGLSYALDLAYTLTDATEYHFWINQDLDDYIRLTNTANNPAIEWVGERGLIKSDADAIDFADDWVNTTGNLTGNLIYAQMWNYSAYGSQWTFPIASADVYYNLTNLSSFDLNGFTHTDNAQASGGSYLTASVSGRYQVTLSVSSELGSGASTVYAYAVAKNHVDQDHCYSRRSASLNTAGSIIVTCLLDLAQGDTVSVQIESETASRDIEIHSANLNLIRIGD